MKNCLLCNTAFLQPDKIGGKEKLYCTIKCRNKAAHNRMLDKIIGTTTYQNKITTPESSTTTYRNEITTPESSATHYRSGTPRNNDFSEEKKYFVTDSMQENYRIGLKAVNFLYDIGFLNETHLKAFGIKFKWN